MEQDVLVLYNTSQSKLLRGLIFNIQRFSIHDGPGIRTVVFFKECPLRCRWCSNPESWNSFIELMTRDKKCMLCGRCVQACPQKAITIGETRVIDRVKCDRCMHCVEVCPTGSLDSIGQQMSLEEVLREVESDRPFYNNSGGGVTISGGEPLNQRDFALELLRTCKEKGLHTAVETCGYVPWETFERILPYIDLLLYDIKHMDPKRHREGTGQDNKLILDNLLRLNLQTKIWLRVPVIPGYNDSMDNFDKMATLFSSISCEKVSLLPYHEWGVAKYQGLGRPYPMEHTPVPSKEWMEELAEFLRSRGLKVTIGH